MENSEFIIGVAFLFGAAFGWWLRGVLKLNRELSRDALEKKQAACIHREMWTVKGATVCVNCGKINP